MERVSFNMAVELKAVKFNLQTDRRFYHGEIEWDSGDWNSWCIDHIVSAPTYGEVLKWFRIKHLYHAELIWDIIDGKLVWFCSVSKVGDLDFELIDLPFYDNELDAYKSAVEKMIELIKK